MPEAAYAPPKPKLTTKELQRSSSLSEYSMQASPSLSMHRQNGVLGQLMLKLYEHLPTITWVAVVVAIAFNLQRRRRLQKPSQDTEAWTDDEKILFELTPSQGTGSWIDDEKALLDLTPSLSTLVADYSHPLAHSFSQQAGIPTSGDLARGQSFNQATHQGPSDLNSGDLSAMAHQANKDQRQHPWRRHSHPQPPSHDHLSGSQSEAVIEEDTLEFFRDDAVGKLWRRRTLEFSSTQES